MSSGVQFSPAELDRLEDALEDLEVLGPPADGADDAVSHRLSEFHELLQLSREAMPVQAVPAGLLDDVLAEARIAAANGAPAEPASWWSRWRLRVWVPTLAFAGSAALLLVMLWPASDADQAAAPELVAKADPAPAQPSASSTRASGNKDGRIASGYGAAVVDNEAPARGGGLAIGDRQDDKVALAQKRAQQDEDEPQAEEGLASERSRTGGAPGAPPRAAKPKPSAEPSRAGGRKAPMPSPAPPPVSKSDDESNKKGSKGKSDAADPWLEVFEGDSLRHQGNCGLATMRYQKARKSKETGVHARALAGLGLCEAAAGRSEAASKLLAQARAADPGVAGFIDSELDRLDGAPASHEPNAAEASEDQAIPAEFE